MAKIKQISIIGLGLMGGSLALALKQRGFDYIIKGYDLCPAYLTEAKEAGAIDVATTSLEEAVSHSQLVVLAVPINTYGDIFHEIKGFLSPGCIVTDLGSVKVEAGEKAREILPPGVEFVGGHPMTGSERGGFPESNPYLYENAYYFLTPGGDISPAAVEIVENMVSDIGGLPVYFSPEEHDLIVSRISHLPHIIAMTLVNFMDQNKGISYLPFIGGGFRDTTRIAAGSPAMWREILLANKKEVLESITAFQALLEEFKDHLALNRGGEVFQSLANAKLIRDSIPQRGRDYLERFFDVIVSIADRPGAIAELTRIISGEGINIKEIEILHSRQNEGGAIRLAFVSQEEQSQVLLILQQAGFKHLYPQEEEDDSDTCLHRTK